MIKKILHLVKFEIRKKYGNFLKHFDHYLKYPSLIKRTQMINLTNDSISAFRGDQKGII